jgi:hypothetical protein
MDDAMETCWRERSEDVLGGMKAWRVAHPTTTCREIEDTVHEHMHRREAQMGQESALDSTQTEWA